MSPKQKVGPNWFDTLKFKIKRLLGMNVFLCDSCKWDWRGACRHPQRPNAWWCPDYEQK